MKKDHLEIGAPTPLAPHHAHEPDLAVASDGSIWVTYSRRDRRGDYIVLQQISEQGDVFGSPEIVSDAVGVETQPCLCIVDSELLVTWVAYRSDQWRLLVRSRMIDEPAWGDEIVLEVNPDGVFHPRVSTDTQGNVYLVAERVYGAQAQLMCIARSNLQWGAVALPATSGTIARPDIASSERLGTFVVYDQYAAGRYACYLQRIDQVEPPIEICPSGYHQLQPTVSTDPEGHLWIAFASNENEARRESWWMTKWSYLTVFDGVSFREPSMPQPGIDVYHEHAYQGWEFPCVCVQSCGRVTLAAQAAHALIVQTIDEHGWTAPADLDRRTWGTWKPRIRMAARADEVWVVSMGLKGAQVQLLSWLTSDEVSTSSRAPHLMLGRAKPAPADSAPPEMPRWHIEDMEGRVLTTYFGELHGHSILSDAAGDVDEYLHRYRDAYRYDFAALTDHDYLDGMELSQSELRRIWNHADRISEDGRFIAMHGYEWTSPAISVHASPGDPVGEGHRHVIYPDDSGPLVSFGEPDANTGAKFIQRMKGQRALIIPHHTAWSGTDWDAHDPELQRVVEVVSAHGRFEEPGNLPIGYRRDHLHPKKFIQEALDRGYRLGFVGGSDSHGLRWHAIELEGRAKHIPHGTRVGWKEDAYRTGMTVVLAPELTRSAIYEALYDRRCYATSGVPIRLTFSINDAIMGSEIQTQAAPIIQARAAGSGPIRSIELIRSGTLTAALHAPAGMSLTELSATWTDELMIPGESHYYYVRVIQEDGNMAWSSPIWVSYT